MTTEILRQPADTGHAAGADEDRTLCGLLARVRQIKRWRLLPVEWTAESGELTPTFKLRRRAVHAKYADVIDALYAD